MKASFVDLRSRTREVLRALQRRESVMLTYRGKDTAVIQPLQSPTSPAAAQPPLTEHEAFGLWLDRDDLTDVPAVVRRLRRGRMDAR